MHENVISRIGMCMPTRSCEEMFEPYINGRDPKKRGLLRNYFTALQRVILVLTYNFYNKFEFPTNEL